MELHVLKRDLVKYSEKIWQKGWVANHDGNLSARLSGGRLLATPTAWSKGEVTQEDLLILDAESGEKKSGRHKVFSEISLHLEYLKARPDAGAILHAHPPCAMALSVAGVEIEPRLTPEAVVSLGDRIPLAPPAMPGSLESKMQVRTLGLLFDVLALGHHGLMSCGENLEQAFLRMELAEHLARVQLEAMKIGGFKLIPDSWVPELLKRRTKAGLGPQARQADPGKKEPDLSHLPVDQIVATIVQKLK